MPKLELQKGHRIFLGLAGAVLVGSCVGICYAWDEHTAMQAEHGLVQGQIAAARAKIGQIDGLERDVIILRENLQEYVRILPNDEEVNQFYADLNDYVREAEVQLTDLTPGAAGKVSSFNKSEYKLSFSAGFHELLHFINLIENHQRFVTVSSLRIKSGREEDGVEGPVLHDVSLTAETFVYVGNAAAAAGVNISGYDRKKVNLSEQIQEARHDLELERFQLLADGNRRDPFVDPRIRVSAGGAQGSEDLEAQRQLIVEVRGLLEECSAIFDLMDGASTMIREMELRHEGIGLMAQVGDKVTQIKARGEISDKNLLRQFESQILGDLVALQQRIGRISEHEKPDENLMRLRGGLERMTQAYQECDYQQVVDVYELVEPIRAQLETHPDAVELGSRMDDLFLVSSTALEFAKQQLVVTGLVQYPDRDDDDLVESVAIINGQVFREGEAITEELFLLEIHEDFLRFEFKGVPLNFDF